MTLPKMFPMRSQSSWGLAVIFYEAPALLATISSQDWAALSSCSRQLRHLIHSSVTILTVTAAREVKDVMTGYWPQLSLIMVQPRIYYVCLPLDSNFVLVACLEADHRNTSEKSNAFVVSHNAQSDQRKSIAAAFRHLQSSNWQNAHRLAVTLEPHGMDEEVVAHTAQSNWPSLTHLSLSHIRQASVCMSQLAKGSWPRLEILDLRANQLDVAAMKALIQGDWPMLTKLTLTSNPLPGSAALAHIHKAVSWANLSQLDLTLVKLDIECIQNLSLLHNQLQFLNLTHTAIGAAAMERLASKAWPQLWGLKLTGNALTADAIASLATADMPSMLHLDLKDTMLDAAAARQLAKGEWNKLGQLDLQDNRLEDVAMAFLAKGHWPNLYKLMLCGNNITVLGVDLLMAGQWPGLCSLLLDTNAVSVGTWTLLGLDTQNLSSVPPGISRDAARAPLIDYPVVWPSLTQVLFRPSQLKICGTRLNYNYITM